jgi:hypothetical protein
MKLVCAPVARVTLAVSLIAAMSLGASAREAAAHATVQVVPSATSVAPGDDFTVDLVVETDHPLGAYTFTFTCDDAALEIVPPVRGGTTVEFSGTPLQNVRSSCEVSISNFQAASLDSPTGTVSVAQVDLHVLDAAAANAASVLEVSVEELTDTDSEPISADIENGEIAIEGAVAVCGDFNGDGDISAPDALGALRVAVGLEQCSLAVCDVDQTGSVSASDALRILNAAVGSGQLDCGS